MGNICGLCMDQNDCGKYYYTREDQLEGTGSFVQQVQTLDNTYPNRTLDVNIGKHVLPEKGSCFRALLYHLQGLLV